MNRITANSKPIIGVGELSALNGVAGAMSERVKMIHIVGQTTRTMQKNHLMIHHSIGNNPNHQQYNNASKGLRFAAAELWDIETAPAEIDRVIRECFIQSGPVYIFLPLDLSAEEVPADLLNTPIDLSPKIDEGAHEKAVSAIVNALKEAKNPAILVDALAQRFGAAAEANELVSKLNIPSFSAPMGKGVIDETHEMYIGVWVGAASPFGVGEVGKASDLVITLGYLPADTNSGGFSRGLKDDNTIYINPFDVVVSLLVFSPRILLEKRTDISTQVKGQNYPNTSIKPLLQALISALPAKPLHSISKPQLSAPRQPSDSSSLKLTQSQLWPTIQSFLRPHDIVIGETGTTNFGLYDVRFPADVRYVSQIYYGSIGFATPATLGVEIARLEMGKSEGRTVLITGDGSMALTIQEVGTMIKVGIKPIIIILNNGGYTVERMIWGAKEGIYSLPLIYLPLASHADRIIAYNDIVPTQYSHLLPLFFHPSPEKSYHLARTRSELESILSSQALQHPEHLQLVEVVLDKLDTSWLLGAQLASRGETARKYLQEEGFVNAYGDWGLSDSVEGSVKWS